MAQFECKLTVIKVSKGKAPPEMFSKLAKIKIKSERGRFRLNKQEKTCLEELQLTKGEDLRRPFDPAILAP